MFEQNKEQHKHAPLMEPHLSEENISKQNKTYIITRGEEWGEGMVREFGINMYTVLYLKWITNKDLP